MAGVEMRNKDKRHAAIRRNFLKENLKRFESARRCTHTNNGKSGFYIEILIPVGEFLCGFGFYCSGILLFHGHILITFTHDGSIDGIRKNCRISRF